MSRHTPPTTALSNGFGGTKAATPQDASGLSQTLQGHVDDIRNLLQCGICIRPLYEPFTLACGHTFCYGCLTSWFTEGRNNKTCPDCRAPVKSQPAPAYLVRAVVQLFTSRAELLDKGETTDQHVAHQFEEAGRIEADKRNTNPHNGGLFKGIFSKARNHAGHPIIDLEDGVVRCPHCSWELEEAGCVNCGYRHDDDSMSDTDFSEENSEMTDDPYMDGEEDIDDFENPIDLEAWDDGRLMAAAGFHAPPHQAQIFGMPRAFYPARNHAAFGPYNRAHPDDDEDEDEEEEDEDEDMDSFIDDGEPTEYASDSGRSTIVGHPDYSREQLHAIFDSPSPEYAHPLILDPHGVPGSEEDSDDHEVRHEDEDEDESETESDTDDEDEAVDTYGEEDEEEEEDEDEDEEPIRPATASNRQRIPTYTILSSSSPLRANGTTATDNANSRARPRTQPTAGSSTNHAIALDDDDDDDSDEGPVAPTRRGRGGIRS
ncbi:uncharacterized protein BDV14DRAFT_174120 [Aspergillus stella-maris]|uniref:uncharacterized protein n=1 Tax=Aspergillus stella-maris TaxID=1810926 RepID=UPI003CCD4CAE